MSFLDRFKKKSQTNFMLDEEKDLGYYVKSGHLLEFIIDGKLQINKKVTALEQKIDWVMLNAQHTATYRWLLAEMMQSITDLNSLMHAYVLPFIQPESKDKKIKCVRGYAQIYVNTMNESRFLLRDLKRKHISEQKTLLQQRITNNYAKYITIAEFLNGISPDRDFVIPTKDRVYVLPPGQVPLNQSRSITPAEFLAQKERVPSREPFPERLPENI